MMCVRQKVKSNSVATDKESGRGLALLHRTILCIKTSTARVRVSSLMQSRRFISIRLFLYFNCHTKYQYESNRHCPHRIKSERLSFVGPSVFRPAGFGR
jgi:hypothetical protein